MLKDCAHVISKPISHIINLSIKTSTVPSIWKSAKVTPIHKSGDTNSPENYRPISVLPTLSKIMEKAVHSQLSGYLESNQLLHECQFGFRKRKSTKLAATYFCDQIRKEMDGGKLTGCVYIDLSKAFDTIGHALLINKLKCYGVQGAELEWFTDYLFGRTQFIDLLNEQSGETTIECGVPQGSILGHLLFIVFFNDLADKIQTAKIVKYADDTVIFFSSKNLYDIEKVLNDEIQLIGEY